VAVWINGRLFPDEAASVSIFDHGLVVGDGVFETVKVADGVPFALTRHLARLQGSAQGLGLAAPDADQIRAAVLALLEESGWPERARVRITVTAGLSALGSERGESPLTVIVALGKLTEWGRTCDVVTVPWPRNEHSAIAGLKTTSYAENVLALSYAVEHGGGEAIFGNTAGNLCEGTGTNVFVVTGGRLITPPLSAGCLAGVTRDLVIEWVGAAEEDLPVGALAVVEEAFLTGTTRDVQPIRRVDGVTLPGAPGPVTRKAAETFAARSAELVDP
jgi:branched-subunit amino acid aminotransferase/4-amino-4-deoxychorismate lyase